MLVTQFSFLREFNNNNNNNNNNSKNNDYNNNKNDNTFQLILLSLIVC